MPAAASPRTLRAFVVVPRRDLCIEFVNTVAWRGSTPAESLHNFAGVLAWLSSTKALPLAAVARLRKWSEAHPAGAAAVFDEIIEIRELVHRMLHALASATTSGHDDLRRFNRALDDAAPRALLDRAEAGFGWRINLKPNATAILAPVLWSASDILVGPASARLRACANDRCLWLFLDDSKNGTRRWCSMQSCGNRAKAHRHYLRHKDD